MRALLSVSDLEGVVAFARGLRELGWDLVATDGTRAALKSDGIDARSVEELTDSPALLGGRVKTLHPRIHAAVLARRDDETHTAELKREGIEPIDLVAVNLYPFGKSAAAGKRGETRVDLDGDIPAWESGAGGLGDQEHGDRSECGGCGWGVPEGGPGPRVQDGRGCGSCNQGE